MKKTISLVLAVLILISAFSLQSFALLGFDKIEKIDVVDCEEFSLKQINDYVAEFEGEEMDEEDNEYPLYCDLDVTISTGEVISSKELDYGYSKNEKRVIDPYAWVKVDECLKAAEEGRNTVPLYVEVYLYSSIDVELDKKTLVSEVSFADQFVKSLTLADGEITFYKDEVNYDYYGFYEYSFAYSEDLAFNIEYCDGRSVTAAVEKNTDSYGYDYYTLDGNWINIYVDNDKKSLAGIYFMDIEITAPATILPYPFDCVEIDDATFDDSFNEKTLTFTVTKYDGSTETVNYEFDYKESVDGKPVTYGPVYVEGIPFEITVFTYLYDDGYPLNLCKQISVETEMRGAIKRFVGPEQEDTLLNRIIYLLSSFIDRIFSIFY